LSFYNIKLNDFIITNTTQIFLGIVTFNGSLMDEHIVLGVIPVDKTIAITDIEPLNCASDFGC